MTADQMQALADELERRLGPAWLRTLAWLRDHNSLGDIERRVANGNYSGAVDGIVEAAEHFANEINSSQKVAARETASWLDDQLDKLVNFDETNHAAVRALSQSRIDIIRGITADQKDTIRSVIEDGISQGMNPRQIARDIRWSIGLTQAQKDIVQNFRDDLQAGRWGAAAGRELGDGRWQQTFARLKRTDGSLSPAQVDQMTQRYADNYQAFRATTIARTEGLRAAHAGHNMMIEQAIDRGVVDRDALVQRWKHSSRGKYARDTHQDMDGQERHPGETFRSGSGADLMFPCDPDGPPEDTINCRCIVTTRYRPA